jgi:hypothetical protein
MAAFLKLIDESTLRPDIARLLPERENAFDERAEREGNVGESER